MLQGLRERVPEDSSAGSVQKFYRIMTRKTVNMGVGEVHRKDDGKCNRIVNRQNEGESLC